MVPVRRNLLLYLSAFLALAAIAVSFAWAVHVDDQPSSGTEGSTTYPFTCDLPGGWEPACRAVR